jgi:hypothetical protein
MSLYRLSNSVISRSAGKSAVAAAAYRSGSVLKDDRLDITHDYSRKENVAWTMILAPEAAPDWVQNREDLWNRVEARESRRDSQVARECLVALPKELTLDQNITLVKNFAIEEFSSKGMIADGALHNVAGNPHAHILLTMREIEGDGFGLKNRDWNQRSLLQDQRKSWADHCNDALEAAGVNERVDHRTLAAQGILRIPQIHLGSHAAQCLEDQKYHPRLERYFEINQANAQLVQLQTQATQVEDQIQVETQQQLQWAEQVLSVANEHILYRIEAGSAFDCSRNRWGIRQGNYQIFLNYSSETEQEIEIYSQREPLVSRKEQGGKQDIEIAQRLNNQDVEYFSRLYEALQRRQQEQAEHQRLERERQESARLERQQQEKKRLEELCRPYKQVYDRIAGSSLEKETEEQCAQQVADKVYEFAIAQGLDPARAKHRVQSIVGYGSTTGQAIVQQSGEAEALQYAQPMALKAAKNWRLDQAEQILDMAIDFFRTQAKAGMVVEEQPDELWVNCDRYTVVVQAQTTESGQQTYLSVVADDRGELARCRRLPGFDEWSIESAQNILPGDQPAFRAGTQSLQRTVVKVPQQELEL